MDGAEVQMDSAEVHRLIRKHGLDRVVDTIDNLALPAIRVNTEIVDENLLPIGASKLGGIPDVPPNFSWPVWRGTPLAFLAQFHLPDLVAFDAQHVLPATGVLSFFYEADTQPWGFEPGDRDAWRVLYYDDDPRQLRHATLPTLPDVSQVLAHAVTFTSYLTVPDEEAYRDQLALTHDEQEAYWDFESEVALRRHQLLGHPWMVQGPMQSWCAQLSQGIVREDSWITSGQPQTPGDITWDQFCRDAVANWRLLFQVDSIATQSRWDTEWGMGGYIYFWIRNDDLARRDFSNVWFQLQTT